MSCCTIGFRAILKRFVQCEICKKIIGNPVFLDNSENVSCLARSLRVDECISDSYLGRDHLFFFLRKSLSNLFKLKFNFRSSTFDFFLSYIHFFLKRKANSPIEQQKCKVTKKRDQILVSKVEFNFQICSRTKKIIYRSSFSNSINFS